LSPKTLSAGSSGTVLEAIPLVEDGKESLMNPLAPLRSPGDPASAPPGLKTILLVSQDPAFVDALRSRIPGLHRRLVVADTGRLALDLASERANGLALAVVDETVPDLEAHQLVYLLRKVRAGLPVLFFAAKPHHEEEAAVRRAGAAVYVPKQDWGMVEELLRHLLQDGTSPGTHGTSSRGHEGLQDEETRP
jgi:DNA-binding NtrC family response regulator